MDFLVQDPGVGGPSVEEGSDLLGGLVTHVEVRDVGEVHVVIEVQAKATTTLLRIFVKFALIHVLFFLCFPRGNIGLITL